jgi:hypothetical protein
MERRALQSAGTDEPIPAGFSVTEEAKKHLSGRPQNQ